MTYSSGPLPLPLSFPFARYLICYWPFFSSILFFLSILCIFCKFTYAFSPPFTIFFFFPYVYVLLSHLSFFPLRAVAMAEGFHDVHPYSKRPHIEPRHCKNNKNTHTHKNKVIHSSLHYICFCHCSFSFRPLCFATFMYCGLQ